MSARGAMVLVLALLLAGCGGNMSDLRSYVARIKARKVTQIPPVPTAKPYQPFTYNPGDRRDPFMPERGPQDQVAAPTPGNGLHPDFNRPKQPLQAYPLDALHMVGTIDFNNTVYAMILAPDGVIHRVRLGEYMGQNYGKVVKITDGEVDLAEIVPDGFGGWKRRSASISLAK